jgi:hypothetical protein
MLQEISRRIPQLKMMELARTQGEKLKLIDQIKHKKHKETEEGIVVFNLNNPTPVKAKIASDYDVLITGTFPAKPGTKYHGNAIGGFLGRPENSNIIIRIGSGLTDQIRRSAYTNPEKYAGQ